MGDLDFERKNIRIRTAKMDKQREIPMTGQLERVLMAYLGTIRPEERRANTPVFRSIGGWKVAPRTVAKIVDRVASRAGTEGYIHMSSVTPSQAALG